MISGTKCYKCYQEGKGKQPKESVASSAAEKLGIKFEKTTLIPAPASDVIHIERKISKTIEFTVSVDIIDMRVSE